MTGLVVAIDGPAGAGKSTLARRLAGALRLPYVNTGLMYRALAFRALRAGVSADDGPALAELAAGMRFDLDRKVSPPSLSIDDQEPASELVSPEVESSVSRASSHVEVRSVMRNEQRRLGGGGAVMEGRDIGTVVFPDAAVKIFLQARTDERVVRRTLEREGAPAPDAEVAEALTARDALDARTNPLAPARDAVVIDTTGLEPDEVFRRAVAVVRERLGELR